MLTVKVLQLYKNRSAEAGTVSVKIWNLIEITSTLTATQSKHTRCIQ